jgi:hypothetical protein
LAAKVIFAHLAIGESQRLQGSCRVSLSTFRYQAAIAFPNLIITKNDRHSRKIESPKTIAILKFNQQDNDDRTLKVIG